MPSTPKETTSTQVQKVELPAWVDQAGQENYQMAKDVSSIPYTAYSGETTAPINGYQTAAGSLSGASASALSSGMDASNGIYSQAAGAMTPTVASPTGVGNVTATTGLGSISDYYNPYEKDVVDAATTAGNQSLALSQAKNTDAAIASGAFGSSRHGVTEGVTAAQGAQDLAGTVAGIKSAGYTQALTALQNAQSRQDAAALANQSSALTTQGQRLTADQANQSAALTANGQRLTAAGGLASNASALNSGLLASASGLNTVGNEAQATQQASDTAAKTAFEAQRDYPTEQLNLRLAALGMTPYGKTTTSSGTSTETGGNNPFLTALGGISSLFSFSDPKLKTDKKRVGTAPSGVPIHQFQYKKDAQKKLGLPAGKQIGFMADEVQKKIPSAVKRVQIGGGETARVVDYAKASRPALFGSATR